MDFLEYLCAKLNGIVIENKVIVFYRNCSLLDRIRFLIGKKIMPPVESVALKKEDFVESQKELEYKKFYESSFEQEKEV